MTADLTRYLELLTPQHRDKPKLEATISASVQGLADDAELALAAQLLFSLDTAVGDQLDKVGEWIGVGRSLDVPLENVYFSFDTAGLGLDEGTWKGPFDPITGLIQLPDESYRTLLRAKVLNNHWDGSIEGAYEIWDTLFADAGVTIFIVDYADLSMSIGMLGTPDAVTLALFTAGHLDVKPAGVQLRSYLTQSVEGAPMFAFDLDNANFAGFDTGAWATITEPP